MINHILLLVCLFCLVQYSLCYRHDNNPWTRYSDITEILEKDLDLEEGIVHIHNLPIKECGSQEELDKVILDYIQLQNTGVLYSYQKPRMEDPIWVLGSSRNVAPILDEKEQVELEDMPISELNRARRDLIYQKDNEALTYLFKMITTKQDSIKIIKRQLILIDGDREEHLLRLSKDGYEIMMNFNNSLKKTIEEYEDDISEYKRLVRKILCDIMEMVQEDLDLDNTKFTHSSYFFI